jgi:NADPH:quinone reductase-like Zn-dependent oxidoreductase
LTAVLEVGYQGPDEKVRFLGSGGGVGTLAGQWGKAKGAYMIGVDD